MSFYKKYVLNLIGLNRNCNCLYLGCIMNVVCFFFFFVCFCQLDLQQGNSVTNCATMFLDGKSTRKLLSFPATIAHTVVKQG